MAQKITGANRATRIFQFQNSQRIYFWLSVAIVYSLVFWTLLNSILCIVLAGYWLLDPKKKWTITTRRAALVILFIALFLISLSGIFYTSNQHEGWFRVQQKTGLLLFPVIFGTSSVLTEVSIKKIGLHFVIATSIACLAGFAYGFFMFLGTGHAEYLTGAGICIFIDTYPYIMGLFCLLSMIFLLSRWPDDQRNRTRIVPATVFLSAFILALSERLIIACWIAIVLFFVFKYIHSSRYRLLAAAFLIIIVVIAIIRIPALQKQWKELIDFSAQNTIVLDQDASLGKSWGGKSIRIAIWKCSADLIRTHWLTGVGTGDVQDSLQAAYERHKFYFASRYNAFNSHNEYIQLIIGNGILAPLAFLLCLVIPFFACRQSPFSEVYFLFLFLFFMISFTEVVLDTNKGLILYSFFNSIFAFAGRDTPAGSSNTKH